MKFLSRFDYLEKLLSNEHSFIIFVVKFQHVFFCCNITIGENYL